MQKPNSTFLNRCLFCQAYCRSSMCLECMRELPWLESCCQRCALPMDESADLCGNCQKSSPSYDSVLALWRYEFPIDQVISRIKYKQDLACIRLAASQFSLAVNKHIQMSDNPVDVLVPVPAHWQRKLNRGIQQAALLCKILADHSNTPRLHALKKHQATHTQQGLSRDQRQRNLADSFTADSRVAGLHIGLIDDVMTTGATAEICSQQLLQAGAKSVQVFCLARTPAPTD